MTVRRLFSLALTIALLLPSASIAEEPGDLDLYAPEISAWAYDAEAPAEELTTAELPILNEPAESECVGHVAAKDAATQTVTLTTRTASARMNVEETLQILVNEGETGTFKSKTTKLATVNASGLVTALAMGTARIEFKPTSGKTRTLTIKIADPYLPTGVSIGQGKSVQINVGEELRLNAVLAPDTARTALTWSSDRTKVASVDTQGVVTALSEGRAKITVKTANKKKASITVNVYDPYKPTGVSIEQGDEMTLNVGDAADLNAVLAPDTARTTLTWKSNRDKVASVTGGGAVTALSEGKAKITVSTTNNKKASIAVTVIDPYKPTGVSIDQGSALTLTAGEGAQLSAALIPDTARSTLTWKSYNTNVATVTADGYVTAVNRGQTKITVTTANGKSASLLLQVTDDSVGPANSAMKTATYNGVEYNIVNTPIDPITYEGLVRDNVCTHPRGTDKYSGYCLVFANFYVSGMVDNLRDADPSVAKRKTRRSKKLSYKTDKYSDPNAMMATLYDLLSAGVPQILMVEAITHPGSRHFVTVVGYRSSVTHRAALRPEDLLIIDSFDGKLESMDPAIEKVDTRTLFKQHGKYRIEAARYKS